MFGYFRPFRIGLDKEEEIVFESYYCRVCYSLWNAGGQRARSLTTFDMAIYSIILNLAGIGHRPPHLYCQRIKRGNKNSYKNDELGQKLANLTLVGFGGKMEDDYLDKQRLRANFTNLIFGRAIRKAYKKEPFILKNTRECCQKINEIQDSFGPAEEALDVYGKASIKSFLTFGDIDEKHQKAIYQLARWSFFMDMMCDYNDDFKNNANNSYKNKKYPTIQAYLNENWQYLVALIRKENTDLFNSIMAIKQRKTEW